MMILDLILLYLINKLITSTSQFKAIFYSIMIYIILSVIIFLLGQEYISLVFLIIYVGALTILFIFAIMLSD